MVTYNSHARGFVVASVKNSLQTSESEDDSCKKTCTNLKKRLERNAIFKKNLRIISWVSSTEAVQDNIYHYCNFLFISISYYYYSLLVSFVMIFRTHPNVSSCDDHSMSHLCLSVQ